MYIFLSARRAYFKNMIWDHIKFADTETIFEKEKSK